MNQIIKKMLEDMKNERQEDISKDDVGELVFLLIKNIFDTLGEGIKEGDNRESTKKVDVSIVNEVGNPVGGIRMNTEDMQLLKFASEYISAYTNNEDVEEYRKFFKGEVLPRPILKDVITYMK